MEFYGEGLRAGLPLDGCAGAGGGGAKALDVRGSSSGGGEGGLRETGGVAGGVEDLDAVGEEGDGIGDEVGWKGVDGLRGAWAYGEAR